MNLPFSYQPHDAACAPPHEKYTILLSIQFVCCSLRIPDRLAVSLAHNTKISSAVGLAVRSAVCLAVRHGSHPIPSHQKASGALADGLEPLQGNTTARISAARSTSCDLPRWQRCAAEAADAVLISRAAVISCMHVLVFIALLSAGTMSIASERVATDCSLHTCI